jgi:hypothetical protein
MTRNSEHPLFPNTSFHGYLPRTICVLHPHGPRTTEIWRFYFTDHDTPSEVNTYLRHHYMRYSGPAGMTEQDDMENWNYATSASRGTIAKHYPFNYQQSLNKISKDSPYAGCVSEQVTEENARAFYRGWRRYMTGDDWNGIYAPAPHHGLAGGD